MSVNKLCPYCGTEKSDGPTEEVVSLRARVKELESALELLKDPHEVWINMLRGTIGYPEHLKKTKERIHELEQRLVNWIKAHGELEQEYSKLQQRLEVLESQHNRKGPKFGEGLKVSDLSSPWVDYGPVKLPPEFQHFTSGTTLPPKCAQCGRVL